MDKREELRRKLERIEREETAKQERPPEQSEASAPSTEAASASPPPAPSLTPEQIQEITRSEIEKALRGERAARLEESASERVRNDARFEELSRGLTDANERLTDTNERVTSLREDTRNSLLPMAEEIAELRSQQNSHALPPAPEPRNVTPRPTPKPTTWPTPSMYPPRLRQTEPEMPSGTLERTSYQPPRTRIESSPPTVEPPYETEPPHPLVMVVWALRAIVLLILVIWGLWTFLAWAWLNPWTAAALIAVTVIFLVWIGAVCLSWTAEARIFSIIIALAGVLVISSACMGYMIYQSLTETKPDINELGR
jgi:hypothetical protein